MRESPTEQHVERGPSDCHHHICSGFSPTIFARRVCLKMLRLLGTPRHIVDPSRFAVDQEVQAPVLQGPVSSQRLVPFVEFR